MREIIVAKTAGFCAGVKRAVDRAFELAETENVCVYGQIIHNTIVTDELERAGVGVINSLDEAGGRSVIIRSHGEPPSFYKELEHRQLPYHDCTCVDVLKIHKIVAEESAAGRRIIIAGQAEHPEIIGINGHAGGDAVIVPSAESFDGISFELGNKYSLVSQTTFEQEELDAIIARLEAAGIDFTVHDTICRSTKMRQREAAEIAKNVGAMVVLGDKKSANSRKLAEICRKYCAKVLFIERISKTELKFLENSDRIGVTAGASTPPAIIKEAINLMNDIEEKKNEESFEEMLGANVVSLHTGATVKGIVIAVTNGEVSVNLGYKSDGLITRSEFSDDPELDPANIVKPGDEIDVFVIRVNDVDGNVMLSKKKVDSIKAMEEVEKAVESKAVMTGKIIESVKGGAIAIINGLRAFVPSSQISNRFVEDIEAFKGKELQFNILEYDKGKRKIIAGRKELVNKLIDEQKAKAFEAIEPGHVVEGTVSRLVDFGAFVDLGGVDGLIHVSELAWSRVRKPSDVLKVGDKVSCYILDVNKEKGKISLSIKSLSNDPWSDAEEKYAVGTVVSGKVVRMTSFGAFVNLEDGIDGLLHISQISDRKTQKVEDALTVGEEIMAKVTDLNIADKKISLSKKAYDRDFAPEEQDAQAADEPVEEASADGFFEKDNAHVEEQE